jgi:hypothetical protein
MRIADIVGWQACPHQRGLETVALPGRERRRQQTAHCGHQSMIPKSGNRFSEKIMRQPKESMIPKSWNRFSEKIMLHPKGRLLTVLLL